MTTIKAQDLERVYPLTPMQEGMLVASLASERAYVMQSRYRIQGALCVESLRVAIHALTQRHAMLRTSVVWRGLKAPKQVVHRSLAPKIERQDLRSLGSTQDKAQLTQRCEALAKAQIEEGFALHRGPLCKWLILQLDDEEFELCRTYHHIITDGWSSALLMRELVGLYLARTRGQALPLATEAPAFHSYVSWCQSQPLGQSQAYWARRLADARVGPLPSRTGPMALAQASLPPQLCQRVASFASAHACTESALLFAVIAQILLRDRGQEDTMFGVVSSLRPIEWTGHERMIGPMIATLPLRARAKEGTAQDWASYVQALGEATAADRQHGELSLAQIAASANTSAAELFDVLVVVENFGRAVTQTSASKDEEHALTLTPKGTWASTHYPVTIYLVLGEQITLRVYARDDALGGAGAKGWVQAMQRGLDAATRPKMTPEKLRDALAAVKAPAPATPLDPWISLWALRASDELAVVQEQEQLSFADLISRAQTLALALSDAGVGPEDRVGVAGDQGPWTLVAMLGIWACNAALVPLDLQGPVRRVHTMLDSAAPKLVLTGPGFELPEQLQGLAEIWDYPTWSRFKPRFDQSLRDWGAKVHPHQLAYLMWTSGSSGPPKAVAVSRGALAQFLGSLAKALDLPEGLRWLSVTRLSFDISLLELLMAPMLRGVCEIAPAFRAQDGAWLAKRLGEGDIQICQATPSSWRMIEAARLMAPQLCALSGGEALEPGLARALAGKVGALWNLYGPTEATVWASAGRVLAGVEQVSLGPPLPGYTLTQFDQGTSRGEIAIGGPGLARGYWQSPRLTAERFVPDPASFGRRRYRSGDRGYADLGGRWYALGRLDRQIKLRGHRLEPAEIEAAIRQSPAIQDAAVWVSQGEQPELIAAYVASEPVSLAQLRLQIERDLPAIAIPSRWLHCTRFPQDRRGKFDRAALVAMQDEATLAQSTKGGQDSDWSRWVAQIWAQTLGCEVQAGADFFALGGHSLLALRICARLEAALGTAVPVPWLLATPKLDAFVRKLQTARASVPSLPSIQPQPGGTGEFQASPAQAQMWWLWKKDPAAGQYNLLVAVKLGHAVKREQLHAALSQLCQRHPLLLTRLERRNATLWCVPCHEDPCDNGRSWGWIDRGAAPLGVSTETQHRFALEKRPAWRLVTRQGPGQLELIFHAHHALLDAASLEILAHEFAQLVQGRTLQAAPQLGYGDFARWLLQPPVEAKMEDDVQRWQNTLPPKGAPAHLAKASRPASTSQGPSSHSVHQDLDPQLCERWLARNQTQMVTHFMVLLAALYRLLVQQSGHTHVCVGAPHHGRVDPGLEGVVGNFVQTLPWSLDLHDAPNGLTLLDRVRAMVLEQSEWTLAPLFRVYDPNQGAPFACLLTVQHEGTGGELAPVEYVQRPQALAKAPLSLVAKIARSGRVQLVLRAHASFCSHEDAQALLDELTKELQTLVDAPKSRPICEYTACAPPQDLARQASTLMARLQTLADRQPKAQALIDAQGEMSYGQLWEQALEIASALADRGVGCGDVVALRMPRDAQMVVAMLGVMMAGAIYLPIELDTPSLRVQSYLELAKVRLCIGSQDTQAEIAWSTLVANAGRQERRDLSHRWSTHLVAYLIMTSGSSGEPKAVAVTQRNLMTLLSSCQARLELGPEDRWSCTHSFAFDFAVFEIWGALAHGASVVLLDHPTRRDPDRVHEALLRHEVTVLSQTPSAFAAYARTLEGPQDLGALRLVVLGGETLAPSVAKAWFDRVGSEGPRLVNMYGITETTVHVTAHAVRLTDTATRVPVGETLAHLGVRVMAEDLSELAVGGVGELWVAGEGVSLGYWQRPRATAWRFVPDPGGDGARMYRSGDLGRKVPDAGLEHWGRKDAQVQILGHRVEPDELCACLKQAPGVSQAKVLVQRDAQGTPSALVAFVCGACTLDMAQLKAWIDERLPRYLRPSAVHQVPKIPRTVNDKCDEAALWASVEARAGEFAASALEIDLAQIMADLLGCSKVGATQSLFELGGHSLMAIELVERIHQRLGIKLALASVLHDPSPRALAGEIAKGPQGQGPMLLPMSTPGRAKDEAPLVLLVHAGGGHVHGYKQLARALDARGMRVLGLVSPALFDRSYRADSLQDWAKRYVRFLAKEQGSFDPAQPLHVVGWSLGAVLGWAIASHWPLSPGVASLCMVDPTRVCEHATSLEQLPEDEALAPGRVGLMQALGVRAQDPLWSRLDPPTRDALVAGWSKALEQGEPFAYLAKIATEHGDMALSPDPSFWRARHDSMLHGAKLARAFVPGSLACTPALWLGPTREAQTSWLQASPSLTVHPSVAQHLDMIQDPDVITQVAQRIADAHPLPQHESPSS